MKTLRHFITIFFCGLSLASIGQNLQASTFVERTHVSPKFGSSFGYQWDNQIELGGFYQTAQENAGVSEHRRRWMEREFYGIYFNYPMIGYAKANVKLNIRTGVVNGETFIITPGVLAHYSPIKQITVGAGLGTRTMRPTYRASLMINL